MNKTKVLFPILLSLIIVFGEFGVFESIRLKAAKKTISMTEEDIHVIPDKYNTGCNGDLKKVEYDDVIEGVRFKKSQSGEKAQLIIDLNTVKDINDSLVFSNLDFSGQDLVVYNENKVDSGKKIRLIFFNCKFKVFRTGEDCPDNVAYEFIKCSFISFIGSQAVLERCNLGHSYNDAMVLFKNVTVKDSYISDLAVYDTAGSGVHSDGVQLYGRENIDIRNINIIRCRFEIPAIKTGENTASVNACLMLQPEYANAIGVHFKNCIINGGGYSIYAECKQRNKSISMSDISFENIKVGYAKLFGTLYPTVDSNVKMIQVEDQDSLYVSSVWKDKDGIHLITTNDTGAERVLKVVTETGVYKFTIPACRGSRDLRYDTSGLTFADFPLDLDIVVPKESGCVVCYDYFDKVNKQIRFVPFEDESVEFEESILNESIISFGKCGKKVTWQVTDKGNLIITGSGETYDYDSGTPAPWSLYKKSIKKITIEEGITILGKSLFDNLTKAKTVSIPSTMTKIGEAAFIRTKLKKVVYNGTKGEWKQIEIEADNGSLTKSKRKYIN